ncbi:unnamed protein product, partial [Mesorhabditis spiculigera]
MPLKIFLLFLFLNYAVSGNYLTNSKLPPLCQGQGDCQANFHCAQVSIFVRKCIPKQIVYGRCSLANHMERCADGFFCCAHAIIGFCARNGERQCL